MTKKGWTIVHKNKKMRGLLALDRLTLKIGHFGHGDKLTQYIRS